jgi:Gas vesicle protein G
MGLLSDVLFVPVTGPLRLLWVALGALQEQANAQLPDEQSLRQELIALNMRLELGQLSESEFREQEAALMQQLKAFRAAKQEMAAEDEESEAT